MTNFSIDIGGSITRCMQKPDRAFTQYESDFLVLPKTQHVIDDVSDKLSTIEIDFNGETYTIVKGESMNFYKQKPEVCDNNCLKADFIGTYLNAIYAMAREVMVPDEFVKIEATCGVCLPPAEVYGEAKMRFIETLAGTINCYAPLANAHVTLDLKPTDIHVYPEGIVSIFSIADPQKMRIIKQSSSLIVDIGYRSTDISLLRNGMLYRGVYSSAPIGGINLEALLNSMLEQNGVFRNRDDLREIMSTGVTKNGTKQVEMGSIVRSVKQQFCPILRDAITKVLNSAGMNLSAINYIIPIGRPFGYSGVAGTESDGGSLVTMLSETLHVQAVEIEDADVSNVIGISKLLNRGSKV